MHIVGIKGDIESIRAATVFDTHCRAGQHGIHFEILEDDPAICIKNCLKRVRTSGSARGVVGDFCILHDKTLPRAVVIIMNSSAVGRVQVVPERSDQVIGLPCGRDVAIAIAGSIRAECEIAIGADLHARFLPCIKRECKWQPHGLGVVVA